MQSVNASTLKFDNLANISIKKFFAIEIMHTFVYCDAIYCEPPQVALKKTKAPE